MSSHAVLHATAASHLVISHHHNDNRCFSSSFLPPLAPSTRRRKKPDISLFKTTTITTTVVRASTAPASTDPRESLERCFRSPDAAGAATGPASSASWACSLPAMKKEYGAYGTVTLEKSKLDLSSKTMKSRPETAVGGGGGDIGKKNFHGGGDGGDDGGDDDDYFDDFDEEDDGDDGGLFRRRIILGELFDKKFVDAVLQEWYKTMADLPAGLRQAYEMNLVSSGQMVRFLEINARPTLERAFARALPESFSREFFGRMLADPSFLYKLFFEQAITIGCSAWWELKTRRERIKQEWDLALINILTVSACNAVVVWSLAPCRSYGNVFQFDLQNTLQKLPNNVFERSYAMREFDLQKRIQSFFCKAAEFCLVGSTAGMIQGALSKISSSKKKERLSVTVPNVNSNALGYGAFLGLYTNLRYQFLCGADLALHYHFDALGVGLFFNAVLRLLNVGVGDKPRLAWLGMEADPLVNSDNLLRAYNRPSEEEQRPSSNWFVSKTAIVSGLGLLGMKQGTNTGDSETTLKSRRKRIVKRKVTGS